MDKIEVKVLNPEVIKEAEKMMVCAARLTQKGHEITDMDKFMELYNKDYKEGTAKAMANLLHSGILRFEKICVVITGSSIRSLMQLRTHQAGVSFVSASRQYSKWDDTGSCVVPYELMHDKNLVEKYKNKCQQDIDFYSKLINEDNIPHDAAAYTLPIGMRNTLIISANPLAWQHIISQRSCNRNTTEIRYVTLKIWEALYNINPNLFGKPCYPFCGKDKCKEGHLSCGKVMGLDKTPTDFLHEDYPLIYK